MGAFNDAYVVARVGYSGRIALTTAGLVYFVPLLNDQRISTTNPTDNDIAGDPTSYQPKTNVKFPLLFSIMSDVNCRVRQRTVHPTSANLTTAQLFTKLTANCGFTKINAGTDLVDYFSIALANSYAATTSTSFRAFDVMNGQNYGMPLQSNVYYPIIVTSLLDCWMQVNPVDPSGVNTAAATAANFTFTCISTPHIIGY